METVPLAQLSECSQKEHNSGRREVQKNKQNILGISSILSASQVLGQGM